MLLKLQLFIRAQIINFIKSWINYQRFKKLDPEDKNIVFYSEGNQDWYHLMFLIKYLTNELYRTVCYITIEKKDFGLKQRNEKLLSFYLKKGFWQKHFLKKVDLNVLVLNIVDLQNSPITHPRFQVYYIYILYTLRNTRMINANGFNDHYDSIFCMSPDQIQMLRKRESLKKLPTKHLFQHGHARLDYLMAQQSSFYIKKTKSDHIRVLLSISGNQEPLIYASMKELITILLQEKFHVIFKVVYMNSKKNQRLGKKIRRKFTHFPHFEYIDIGNETNSLLISDILISHWSPLSVEYALALEKPVLFIEPLTDKNGLVGERSHLEPVERVIRQEIGENLPFDQLEKAPYYINSLLKNRKQFQRKMVNLRRRLIFNPGLSVKIGAEEIVRLADERMRIRKSDSMV